MKRLFLILLAIAAAAGLFSGCGSEELPDGFNRDEVESRAVLIAETLTALDYETVAGMVREDLKEALSAEVLENALGPTLEGLGAFESSSITMGGTKGSDGEEYTVAVVSWKCEDGKVTFTLSFDKDLNIVGLYMK